MCGAVSVVWTCRWCECCSCSCARVVVLFVRVWPIVGDYYRVSCVRVVRVCECACTVCVWVSRVLCESVMRVWMWNVVSECVITWCSIFPVLIMTTLETGIKHTSMGLLHPNNQTLEPIELDLHRLNHRIKQTKEHILVINKSRSKRNPVRLLGLGLGLGLNPNPNTYVCSYWLVTGVFPDCKKTGSWYAMMLNRQNSRSVSEWNTKKRANEQVDQTWSFISGPCHSDTWPCHDKFPPCHGELGMLKVKKSMMTNFYHATATISKLNDTLNREPYYVNFTIN